MTKTLKILCNYPSAQHKNETEILPNSWKSWFVGLALFCGPHQQCVRYKFSILKRFTAINYPLKVILYRIDHTLYNRDSRLHSKQVNENVSWATVCSIVAVALITVFFTSSCIFGQWWSGDCINFQLIFRRYWSLLFHLSHFCTFSWTKFMHAY